MADVASALRSWSATAGSNSPSGSTVIGAGLDDNLRTIQAVVRQYLASTASNMASAATVDLSTADGFYVNITGGTTITSFGTESAGVHYVIKFASALTLTHNATSLILPGGANITTVAGDIAWVMSEGSGNWRCLHYSGTGTTSQQGVLELATTAEVQTGTDTARAVPPAALHAGKSVLKTLTASTSGTSIDFTSIPAWAKRITIMFSGVSVSGTDSLLVQIGDSGGLETSGYLGAAGAIQNAGSSTTANYTTGFGILSGAGGNVIHGTMTLALMDAATNLWASSHSVGWSSTAITGHGGGSKALSATLDRVSVLTTGANTFDAGNINILYE